MATAAPPSSAGGPKTTNTTTTIRVGTRRSALALRQVELIVAALSAAHPGVAFETVTVSVMGDRDKTTPLPDLGKGLWTSELEAMLTSDPPALDMIVHCLKDMPTALPAGCALGCITAREDPRDVVVFAARHGGRYATLAALPAGAVVGTSSVRRAAQLRARYPGLRFRDMRGNIDTRLRKCDDDALGYDATILAAAGLHRMALGHRIGQYLDSATEGGGMLHAVGQGALAIEVREGDEAVLGLLAPVADRATMLATEAERSVMRTLEGGCSVPIGVETSWAPADDDKNDNDKEGPKVLRLRAVVISIDGADLAEVEVEGEVADPEVADVLGKKAAALLVERGAGKILDAINKTRAETPGTVSAAAVAA